MEVRVPAFDDAAACHLKAELLSFESRSSTLCRWQAATVTLAQALRVNSNVECHRRLLIISQTVSLCKAGSRRALSKWRRRRGLDTKVKPQDGVTACFICTLRRQANTLKMAQALRLKMNCLDNYACLNFEHCSVMQCRRQADTVKLAQALRVNIARKGRGKGSHNGHSPFEFRVLECLLAATVGYFEGRSSWQCESRAHGGANAAAL